MRARTLTPFAVPSLFGPLYIEFAVIGIAAVWSYRNGWPRILTGFGLLLVLLVNSAQLVAMTFSSDYITPPVIRLVSLIRTMVSSQSVAMVGIGSGVGLLVLWLGFHLVKWESATFGNRLFASAVIAIWGLSLFGTTFLPPARHLRSRYGLRPGAPVLSLCLAAKDALFDSEPRAPVPTPEELRLALDAGITIEPKALEPFRKDWIYKRPLPFPTRPESPKRPNVIVFFFESWSAEVLGPYNPRWLHVTPNLNDFAQHAMRVDDYVNHAIPTVTGLRGQLCSMFPRLAYTPWHQRDKPVVGQVFCLPKLLNRAGYESIYLNHGAASATHFDSQAIDWGFKHAYFIDGVLGDLLHDEKPGHEGVDASDEQMMRATISLLEKRASRRDAEPLFLAISTFQTHTGVDIAHKFGNGRNPVLNTFNNLDEAFGLFWRWYQTSSWAKNTILILTGDHVMYPHNYYRQVATKRYLNDRFGYLGLFIMDPTHVLPSSFSVRSTSIDFAPTLIQLLNLPSKQSNPFMGLSMFGDRQATPIALGFNYGTDVLIWERTHENPEIFHSPKTGRPRELFDVLRFEQQMEHDNRLWFR